MDRETFLLSFHPLLVRVVLREPLGQPRNRALGSGLVHLAQAFEKRRADVFLKVVFVVLGLILGAPSELVNGPVVTWESEKEHSYEIHFCVSRVGACYF